MCLKFNGSLSGRQLGSITRKTERQRPITERQAVERGQECRVVAVREFDDLPVMMAGVKFCCWLSIHNSCRFIESRQQKRNKVNDALLAFNTLSLYRNSSIVYKLHTFWSFILYLKSEITDSNCIITTHFQVKPKAPSGRLSMNHVKEHRG